MERNGAVNTKVFLAFTVAVAALAIAVALRSPRVQTSNNDSQQQPDSGVSSTPVGSTPVPRASGSDSVSQQNAPSSIKPPSTQEPTETPSLPTNKLERLTQVRESFRALANGNATTALRAAKEITDETER